MHPDQYPEAALTLPDVWIEDLMQEVEAKWILGQLQDAQHVLELGWGSGIITRALLDSGKNVTVIEGSAELCEKAREAGAYVVHSLFEEAETPRPMYDCVIASFVLEHVLQPVTLLKRCRKWSNKLIVVIGNAESYHRRLAVMMGLQPELDTLSERDKVVGHYRVYSDWTIERDLDDSGWDILQAEGIMLKPLPNSMLLNLPRSLVKAMTLADVPPQFAANIGYLCQPTR